MSTQNENLFVKLIKKSLGLPTGVSNCCGAPASQSADCCGAGASSECCGAEEDKESEASPAVGLPAI